MKRVERKWTTKAEIKKCMLKVFEPKKIEKMKIKRCCVYFSTLSRSDTRLSCSFASDNGNDCSGDGDVDGNDSFKHTSRQSHKTIKVQ